MGMMGGCAVTWRFVKGAAGLTGPNRSFVRTRVDGRDVPTYVVTRNAANWGYVLQSCW
jgi:hypothetical protein